MWYKLSLLYPVFQDNANFPPPDAHGRNQFFDAATGERLQASKRAASLEKRSEEPR